MNGKTISYGSSITAIQSPLTGNINKIVYADITGLAGNHYRAKAENELGTIYSDDMIFVTLGQIPTV